MKKILLYVAISILAAFVFNSCTEDEEIFEQQYLIGKWQSGTEFYKYLSNGSGATWDTSDDVDESEAQNFTWTLVKSELTHIHIMEMGGTVPKVYTVTELTSTTLKYEDNFNKKFSFTKVSN